MPFLQLAVGVRLLGIHDSENRATNSVHAIGAIQQYCFIPCEPMIRSLSKCLAVVLLLFSIGLIVMWIRSYKSADRLHGRMWERQSCLVASKQGRVVFLWFKAHGHPDWWKWETLSYSIDDIMSFPAGDIRQYENGYGFGTLHDPMYFVMPPTIRAADGTQWHVNGAATASLRGSGVIMPYWVLLLVASVTAALFTFRKPWRFSLRGLMAVVALVAASFGLRAIIDR